MPENLDERHDRVPRAIAELRLVAFLGAGANLCGRPPGVDWHPDGPRICHTARSRRVAPCGADGR